jgi:hypothetical protein
LLEGLTLVKHYILKKQLWLSINIFTHPISTLKT